TGLFPHFTVEGNVALVPRLERWPEERTQARVRELLAVVGLDPGVFGGGYPREVSGGRRRRVGGARGLGGGPPIVLIGGPLWGLDPIARAELQGEVAALAERLGKTIVFVTHDIREAFLLASRIGLFKDGRLVEMATAAEFRQSDDSEARAFMDSLG